MVMNFWFRRVRSEEEGKLYATVFSLAVFLVQVRQPAAFMEMDRTQRSTAAAPSYVFTPKPPHNAAATQHCISSLEDICKLLFLQPIWDLRHKDAFIKDPLQ